MSVLSFGIRNSDSGLAEFFLITYWEITTDPETMPENSTSFVMTNLQGNLKKTLGDLYGLRTWVEYGFRQCKQELVQHGVS